PPKRERKGGGEAAASGDELVSPLQGNVFKVPVEEGQGVSEGDLVCVIEAMKMENEITAHKTGKITSLPAKEGASVNPGDVLAKIE
ncbi:MAG TPA: biotin/lipoyl-containing protein, partial [Solirubrobacterales bacterium]|nr:biotin/lipoyl-containing protein [Solirubrobacterales bacterium]